MTSKNGPNTKEVNLKIVMENLRNIKRIYGISFSRIAKFINRSRGWFYHLKYNRAKLSYGEMAAIAGLFKIKPKTLNSKMDLKMVIKSLDKYQKEIKTKRARLKISQQELADNTGLYQATINNIEHGRAKITISQYKKIKKFFEDSGE